MKKLIYSTACILVILFTNACHRKKDTPAPYNYANVPDGGTAVIENSNLSGNGLIVNKANTTFVLKGNVVLDDLSIIGNVVIESGADVQVKGLVNIAGGAKLTLRGKLSCTNFTQIGNIYLSGAHLIVTNQFTNSGGTKVYLENSKISVEDLRILGSIVALQNDATKNGNIYSLIYFTGTDLYLNRAGGTTICGPVVFTYNNDMGASQVKTTKINDTVITAKSNFFTLYSIPDTESLYQFDDQNCTPQISPTGF